MTLANLLKRDQLDIPEVELFQAVLKWSDFQCSKKDAGVKITREDRRSAIGDAIYDLRFLAMKEREFAQNVATSGLFTAEEMIPIYNKFNDVDSPNLKWKLLENRTRNIPFKENCYNHISHSSKRVVGKAKKKMKRKKRPDRWNFIY